MDIDILHIIMTELPSKDLDEGYDADELLAELRSIAGYKTLEQIETEKQQIVDITEFEDFVENFDYEEIDEEKK